MGNARESDRALPVEHVRTRPKVLTPKRLAPVRVEGRVIASELLGRVIGEESERVSHIARILGCSETLVWAWLSPEAKQNFPVGDLVALRLGGAGALAYAYMDEIARWLRASMARGLSPLEHVSELSKATGAAVVALTESTDRHTKAHAVRTLKRRCDEVLADLDRDAGGR